jgi:putative transposase
MTNYGCQQILLDNQLEEKPILEYLCLESNNLYNCAVYYARQIWFKTGQVVTGFQLTRELKTNRHFMAGYASAMQQTCLNVGEAFKSFKVLLTKAQKGELDQRPRPPAYRRSGGMFIVTYPKKWLKLIEGKIRFPLGQQVKAWFGISEFWLPMPTNLDWNKIREVRILPRNGCFYGEFVYEIENSRKVLDPRKCLGIDHGVNNWLACVSNVGTSFLIDGLHLKSLNQFYNKQIADIKTGKPQGFWSRKLATITEKRNRQVRDAVNKAARMVISHCIEHSIGRVVLGWNQGQKNRSNMGKKTNQQFVQIPTGKLKDRIAQLCEQYGIQFIETEESYTSKASFLDSDTLPTYGEKPERWKESGKRVQRGLYRSGDGTHLNADCNGAANILAKVAATLGLCLEGVSSGALTTPLRIRLWTAPKSPSL